MTTTDAVLAQIADALDDWDVGPDAMRCGAPRRPLVEGVPPDPPRVVTVSGGVAIVRASRYVLLPAETNWGWTLTDEPGGRP